MKNIIYIFLFLVVSSQLGMSATRGDVKVLEASENIRYLSQKIVKDYLFYYKHSNQEEIKKTLHRELRELSRDLRIIATTTKDSDTKDILEFLAYSKDQIEEIFNTEVTEENAALMLDYSETLLEGADSIARAHTYDFSAEEKMFMTTKKVEYLLERISKYYMAVHVGFDSTVNKEQMQSSMVNLEENLVQVALYGYPTEIKNIQLDLDQAWSSNRTYLMMSKELFIPKLLSLSVVHMEKMISQLALYHSKNQ